MEANHTTALPNEIQQLVKTYSIKDIFREQAEQINLPQFYLIVPANDLFGKKEEELPLEKENLLEGFALSKADTNIAFDSITSELYKVDLDETKKEHTPTFVRLDGEVKESVMTYILDLRMLVKLIRVPSTGSTVLLLTRLMRFEKAGSASKRAFMRS